MSKASIVIVDKNGNPIDLVERHTQPDVFNARLITKEEAVARCGVTAKQFDALIKEGVFPGPQPGTRKWERKTLYEWIDLRKIGTDRIDPGYVYFMEMGEFIKIGWAAWPKLRQMHLQIGNPYDLVLLGGFPGSLENEAALHTLFEHLRGRGEWFRKSPGLLAYIAWLKIVWRGNAKVIPGDLDNVVTMNSAR